MSAAAKPAAPAANKKDKLVANAKVVRTGGKGTVRRKKKVVRQAGGSDSNKLAATLKRNGVSQLPGCEEAALYKNNGKVLHFTNPKVQASVQANTYFISGKCEEKDENDFSALNQDMWNAMQGGANAHGAESAPADDDAPPELVNFDPAGQ